LGTKISVAKLGIAVTVLALVANAYVGIAYMRDTGERDRLVASIAEQGELLSQQDDAATLRQLIDNVESQLVSERESLPTENGTSALLQSLLALGDDAGVRVSHLVTRPKQDGRFGNSTYTVVSVSIEATGSMSQLDVFLGSLQDNLLTGSNIDEISITGIDSSPRAVVELSVYYLAEESQG